MAGKFAQISICSNFEVGYFGVRFFWIRKLNEFVAENRVMSEGRGRERMG